MIEDKMLNGASPMKTNRIANVGIILTNPTHNNMNIQPLSWKKFPAKQMRERETENPNRYTPFNQPVPLRSINRSHSVQSQPLHSVQSCCSGPALGPNEANNPFPVRETGLSPQTKSQKFWVPLAKYQFNCTRAQHAYKNCFYYIIEFLQLILRPFICPNFGCGFFMAGYKGGFLLSNSIHQ